MGILVIALMRDGTERRNRAAAGLHADPPVLRQIIIDKNPAAGQYVRLLLENNGRVSRAVGPPARPGRATTRGSKQLLCGQLKKSGKRALAFQNQITFRGKKCLSYTTRYLNFKINWIQFKTLCTDCHAIYATEPLEIFSCFKGLLI